MNEYLPIIFSVVLIIITIVLSVVGVQIILVLAELKKTLQKANAVIDMAENKVNTITTSVKSLGGAMTGLTAGFKVVDGFVKWLSKRKSDQDEEKK